MKPVMHRRGASRFCRFFCLTGSKKFVGDTRVFQKRSGIDKIYGQNRGYHVFPSKFYCLTVPKKFVEEHFCVPEKLRG